MEHDELLKVLIEDTKDIKACLIELVKQSAVHNTLLKEHERRSTLLEEQFKPIQAHVTLVQRILYVLAAIFIAVISQWAIGFFLK